MTKSQEQCEAFAATLGISPDDRLWKLSQQISHPLAVHGGEAFDRAMERGASEEEAKSVVALSYFVLASTAAELVERGKPYGVIGELR